VICWFSKLEQKIVEQKGFLKTEADGQEEKGNNFFGVEVVL
jgi:hypothetical protein